MKIAIIGYGRMGKKVEEIASNRNHHIHCIIDSEQDWSTKKQKLGQCDVAIEFSIAETVVENIRRCHEAGLAVVTGTTGWDKARIRMIEDMQQHENTLFFAPNFSIGVNLLFEINRQLAQLIEPHTQYKASISETHHIHKLDAPSGTAIALADDIISRNKTIEKWVKDAASDRTELAVASKREGEVIGDHQVTWDSDVDTISIKHHAKNRNGFALGAVIAAEWVHDKKGYFEMPDMLFNRD
jgi:4-hydroxy-tetrahydrodipicolinate reductase